MLENETLCEAFLEHLINVGLIDEDAAVAALDEQRRTTPQIGRLALDRGLMTMKQVFAVLRHQADSGLRFGEQAIDLGLITDEDLDALLGAQREARPGIGGVLFELGIAKKGELQKERRAFMRKVESVLT